MQRFSRPAVVLLAVLVGVITFAIVANAAMVCTVPNAATYSYALNPNLSFIIPLVLPLDRPVQVMGVMTTAGGAQGVGQATLLRSSAGFIQWVGVESFPGGISFGRSAAMGAHIVFLDQPHQVDIEVNNAATIRVHNSAAQPRAGNVTLIW